MTADAVEAVVNAFDINGTTSNMSEIDVRQAVNAADKADEVRSISSCADDVNVAANTSEFGIGLTTNTDKSDFIEITSTCTADMNRVANVNEANVKGLANIGEADVKAAAKVGDAD